MSIYWMCAAFAAGIAVMGAGALWWDYKHPRPVRWDLRSHDYEPGVSGWKLRG